MVIQNHKFMTFILMISYYLELLGPSAPIFSSAKVNRHTKSMQPLLRLDMWLLLKIKLAKKNLD